MTGINALKTNLIQKLLSLRRFQVDIKSVFAFGFVRTQVMVSWRMDVGLVTYPQSLS